MSDVTKRSLDATDLLAAIVDSSDDAIVSKDLDGIITSWNFGAEQIFGFSENEVVGKSITIIIPADRQGEETDILAHIRRGERIKHFETLRQRKDGSLIDVSLTISPIIGPDGCIAGASKIARDVSERKALEKTRDVLFREMRHRVRNTLALAAAICRQTFHSATDEEYSIFFSRIQALAAAHELLSKESWEGASIKDVVAKAMEPHRTGQGRIHITGQNISIGSGKAVSIALALHELATNAAKYGALSGATGSVHIEWEVFVREETDTVRFRWQERGGPVVTEPCRKGFGSRLIERGLAAEFRRDRPGFSSRRRCLHLRVFSHRCGRWLARDSLPTLKLFSAVSHEAAGTLLWISLRLYAQLPIYCLEKCVDILQIAHPHGPAGKGFVLGIAGHPAQCAGGDLLRVHRLLPHGRSNRPSLQPSSAGTD